MCSWITKIKRIFQKEKPIHPTKRRLILAIDDDPGQRTLVQRTLEKRGHRVVVAQTGEEGLRVAARDLPNVILLDYRMPKMDGHSVCRRLKEEEKTKDIPVIFLTSADSPHDIIEHYELGADVHLTKPIDPKELIIQVETTLGID